MTTHASDSLDRIETLLDAVDLDAPALLRSLPLWLADTLPRSGGFPSWSLEPGHLAGDASRGITPAVVVGPPDAARRLVVTSGIHGVEGRFGLLLQLRFLGALAARGSLPRGLGVVLPFALNAHGFSRARRWCEANSDLNRGFALGSEGAHAPAGASPVAREVWSELNARFGPRAVRPTHVAFAAAAAKLIARHGWKALLEALPQGQSAHADFIFHNAPQAPDVARIKDAFLAFVDGAERVVHVDLHTGYGPKGHADVITPSGPVTRTVGPVVEIYTVAGSFNEWSASVLGSRGESCVIEFGTEPGLKVFFRLLRENHSFQTGDAEWNAHDRRWVLETFFPTDRPWREGALRKGVASLLAAFDGLATGANDATDATDATEASGARP